MTATADFKTLCERLAIRWELGAKYPAKFDELPSSDMTDYRCVLFYQGRKFTFDYFMGVLIGHPPTVEMCVDSLLLDASSADQTFENWASDCEADTDSIKARKLYRECCRIRKAMERLLGDDFDTFMQAER